MPVFVLLGHVGHGKTSLCEDLVGTSLDRLPEEKKGKRTVDSHAISTPIVAGAGRQLSLLDAPGHERYRRNLLAALAGASRFVLVVAADEGLCPQTEEQLLQLPWLGPRRGVVVVTKARRVSAPERAAVEDAARARCAELSLEIIECVHRDRAAPESLTAVRDALTRLAEDAVATSPDEERLGHLWIDRTFVPTGHGRVVTGTWRGRSGLPAEVFDAHLGRVLRIRRAERHGRTAELFLAGERVSLELAGGDAVERGALLTEQRHVAASDVADVLLSGPRRPLRRGATYWCVTGTYGGAATLLDTLTVAGTDVVRLRFAEACPLPWDASLVLRDFGGEHTVAGGRCLDPRARGALRAWATEGGGVGYLAKCAAVTSEEMRRDSLLVTPERTLAGAARKVGTFSMAVPSWERAQAALRALVESARESDLQKRVEKSARLPKAAAREIVREALDAEELFRWEDRYYSSGARDATKAQCRATWEKVRARLHGHGAETVKAEELGAESDRDRALAVLAMEGEAVLLDDERWLDGATFRNAVAVCERMATEGTPALAELRKALPFSRRDAVRFLETLDRWGWMERMGGGECRRWLGRTPAS